MINSTITLLSSRSVKTPAMDDLPTVQTLALVAYAPEQTNVYNASVTNMHLLNAQDLFIIYKANTINAAVT